MHSPSRQPSSHCASSGGKSAIKEPRNLCLSRLNIFGMVPSPHFRLIPFKINGRTASIHTHFPPYSSARDLGQHGRPHAASAPCARARTPSHQEARRLLRRFPRARFVPVRKFPSHRDASARANRREVGDAGETRKPDELLEFREEGRGSGRGGEAKAGARRGWRVPSTTASVATLTVHQTETQN